MEPKGSGKYILIAMFTAIVSMAISCKVARPYKQPAGEGSARLFRDVSNADTTTIANISWKEMFSDTLLQSLIQQGINNNLDLKVAVARIKVAAANARQGEAGFFARR